MLTHLGENGADIEVNIAGVRDLEALIDGLVTEMEVVVLDFECLLEVGEGGSKLLSATEDTGEVVVSYSTVPITFLSQTDSLVEELEGHLEVLLLKEAH